METFEAIFSRQSIRAYLPDQIPLEDVLKIIKAGLHAPSGMNKQAVHITAIHSLEKIRQLEDAVHLALRQTQENLPEYEHPLSYRSPTLMIVSVSPESVAPEMDAAAAQENMLLAATALHISSCWINLLYGKDSLAPIREILTEFGVPSENKVICCTALGYADSLTQGTLKKNERFNIVK